MNNKKNMISIVLALYAVVFLFFAWRMFVYSIDFPSGFMFYIAASRFTAIALLTMALLILSRKLYSLLILFLSIVTLLNIVVLIAVPLVAISTQREYTYVHISLRFIIETLLPVIVSFLIFISALIILTRKKVKEEFKELSSK